MVGSLYDYDDPKGYRKKQTLAKQVQRVAPILLAVVLLVLVWRNMSLGWQLTAKSNTLSLSQQRLDETQEERERWKIASDTKDRSIATLQRSVDRLQTDLDNLKKSSTADRTKASSLQSDMHRMLTKVRALETELAEAKKGAERTGDSKKQVEQLTIRLKAAEDAAAAEHAEAARLEHDCYVNERALRQKVSDLEGRLKLPGRPQLVPDSQSTQAGPLGPVNPAAGQAAPLPPQDPKAIPQQQASPQQQVSQPSLQHQGQPAGAQLEHTHPQQEQQNEAGTSPHHTPPAETGDEHAHDPHDPDLDAVNDNYNYNWADYSDLWAAQHTWDADYHDMLKDYDWSNWEQEQEKVGGQQEEHVQEHDVEGSTHH